MRKILLLGGTGAMGVHLTQLLAAIPEDQIFVTTRGKKKNSQNITYIQGNAMEEIFIHSLLSNTKWDVIVDFMIYSTDLFKSRVNMLLQSAEQYVYLSSSRVYSECLDLITEHHLRLLDSCNDHNYLQTDEYALTKARQEDILKKSGKNNWTIIRPYITYSENRLQLGVLEKENWLYRALKGRTIVFSRDIMERYTTLTYGYDVARGIASVIGCTKAYGETFHITCGESIKWGDVLNIYIEEIEKFTGCKPNVKILEKYPYQHPKFPFYQLCYDRLYDRKFDSSKIGNFIDLTTFMSPAEGLRKCIQAFLKKQDFHNISFRGEASRDRLTKEHAPLAEMPSSKVRLKYLIQRYILPDSYFYARYLIK